MYNYAIYRIMWSIDVLLIFQSQPPHCWTQKRGNMRQIQKNKSCKVEPCNKTNKQTNKSQKDSLPSFFPFFFPTTIALRVKGSAILFITWRTDIPIKTKWSVLWWSASIYMQKRTYWGTSALPRARTYGNIWGGEKAMANQGSWGSYSK